ncbi:PLDc N-terminal domain-containing protein [Marinigracilibium pacificum]|uniref:Phospholipase D-like protein n=1 Tax=Marinigracilibium pacificum TaxID=2729599 RepID=A0A848IX69_9BACT|nr:hypothetical protein [Marinigracilibium pacificum]
MHEYLLITFITLFLILWASTIINIVLSRFKRPHYQTFWLVFVLVAPMIGAFLFPIFRKRFTISRNREFKIIKQA